MRRPGFERPFRSRAGGELGLVDGRAFPARTFERTGQERFSLEIQDTGGFLQEVATLKDFREVWGTQTVSGASFSIWVKWIGPTPAGNDGLLYTGDATTNSPFGLLWGPSVVSGLNFYFGSGGVASSRALSPGLTSGVWYHACGTWNPAGGGTTVSGFLNADTTGFTNTSSRVTAFTAETAIPLGLGPNFWRNGTNVTAGQRLYGLQVWNRPLVLAEVQALYNGGTPLQTMTPALLSGLKLWWRLGDSYQERQRIGELSQAMSPPGIIRDLSGNGNHGLAWSRHGTGPNLPDFVADVP